MLSEKRTKVASLKKDVGPAPSDEVLLMSRSELRIDIPPISPSYFASRSPRAPYGSRAVVHEVYL
eukprot:8702866-Pyramimonas_sp.AAC.2